MELKLIHSFVVLVFFFELCGLFVYLCILVCFCSVVLGFFFFLVCRSFSFVGFLGGDLRDVYMLHIVSR